MSKISVLFRHLQLHVQKNKFMFHVKKKNKAAIAPPLPTTAAAAGAAAAIRYT